MPPGAGYKSWGKLVNPFHSSRGRQFQTRVQRQYYKNRRWNTIFDNAMRKVNRRNYKRNFWNRVGQIADNYSNTIQRNRRRAIARRQQLRWQRRNNIF